MISHFFLAGYNLKEPHLKTGRKNHLTKLSVTGLRK